MDTRPVQYARTSDGVNIAFTDRGEGQPVVYLTHLETQQGGYYEVEGISDLLQAFAGRARGITFDYRGSGLSDRDVGELTTETRLRDLQAVVDTLDLERFTLWSSISGGLAAMRYAAEHPDRVSHLILWNAFARIDEFMFEVPRNVALGKLMASDWELFTETVMTVAFGWGAEKGRRYGQMFREAMDEETYQRRVRDELHTDVTDLLPTIQCPTLVLFNDRQGHVTAAMSRELAVSIPNATFKVIPGWMLDGLDEVADTVDAFLGIDRVGSPPAPVPGGFQTVMFTDLEASTALTQRLGDEGAQDLLRGHNSTVRGALEANGGREVKHTGDGIMASFPSAVAAVVAALAIQRELVGGEVRVRIGLNAGEPIAEDGDLFGTAVQLAARVTDRAAPGQVLVTRVVADLCAGKTFQFASIGGASMKGFDAPVELFEVRVGGPA